MANCDKLIELEALTYYLHFLEWTEGVVWGLHRYLDLILARRRVNFILHYPRHLMILGQTRLHTSSIFLTIFIAIVTPSKTFFYVFLYFGNISTCCLLLRRNSRPLYLFEPHQKYLQQPMEVLEVCRIQVQKNQSYLNFSQTNVLVFLLHLDSVHPYWHCFLVTFCPINEWRCFDRSRRKSRLNLFATEKYLLRVFSYAVLPFIVCAFLLHPAFHPVIRHYRLWTQYLFHREYWRIPPTLVSSGDKSFNRLYFHHNSSKHSRNNFSLFYALYLLPAP